MSRTLFWYVFRDLMRIFLLTLVALTGIMSFGGLLRPLTDQGLDVSQVGKVLAFFVPAMMTYSLPIAAVFATTMVYGRLSADNELLACRATGLSHLSIALPALVLGLAVAIVSLLLLCFIVPVFMLRVEGVVKSNLAQWVANQIERSHQIKFGNLNIFAERAQVAPQKDEREQVVVLSGPLITTYYPSNRFASLRRPREREVRVPERFYMARQATVYFTPAPNTETVLVHARLENGTSFGRELAGSAQGGIQATEFGPFPVESLVKENTKFMDILQLNEVYLHPEKSRRLNDKRMEMVRYEQGVAFLAMLRQQWIEQGELRLSSTVNPNERLSLGGRWDAPPTLEGEEIVLRGFGQERSLRCVRADASGELSAEAREVRLLARPDNVSGRMLVTAMLLDPVIHTGDQRSSRSSFSASMKVEMPPEIQAIQLRPTDYYATAPHLREVSDHQKSLRQMLHLLRNKVQSEKNGRAAFAISCLILVLIGCALGMMFRSGNFLSAFAFSAVPAILIITLIISGQQVAENPQVSGALRKGLLLIWSGNAAVAALAVVLLWRLQRQ